LTGSRLIKYCASYVNGAWLPIWVRWRPGITVL
jgi:hypothetical protein